MKIAAGAGGHSKKAPGAKKYIDEYTEDRKVVKAFVKEVKSRGVGCTNCSNEKSTQSAELAEECRLANKSGADLFLAFHFNAASTTSGTRGVEVWYYSGSAEGKAHAKKVSSKLAKALGLKDRGAKATTSLYVLKHTTMPAILVEVCFVDAKGDVTAYKELGASGVAKAVADAILGSSSGSSSSGSSSSGSSPKPSSAKSTKYAVTAKSGLNFRKGPGTKYAKTRALAKGKTVNVTSVSGGWAKTTAGDYGCATYLKKAGTASYTKYKVTAKSGLNFRKGPGTGYKKTRALAKGKTVSVVSKSGGWCKTTAGDYGYSKYLKKV